MLPFTDMSLRNGISVGGKAPRNQPRPVPKTAEQSQMALFEYVSCFAATAVTNMPSKGVNTGCLSREKPLIALSPVEARP